MDDAASCPFCEADISATASKCRHCGEWVARGCDACGTPLRGEWAARGRCAECRKETAVVPATSRLARSRSRGTAALLALLLGGIGAHKFYLDKPGQGAVYFLLCWTFIPVVVSMFEGVGYLLADDEEFWRRFG